MTDHDFRLDPGVAAVRVPREMREHAGGRDELSRRLCRVGELLGWNAASAGPFGAAIPSGARVLVKPNWVMHENRGPWGREPLVTDPALIQAVVAGVLQARPSAVVVGDAPIQSCDLDHLLDATGLRRWATELEARERRFEGLRDFRRTTCGFRYGVRQAHENQLPESDFVLFDLGADSMLEPVTDGRGSFRVTQYDPREMAKTHAPRRHRYLVARAIVESGVVINLPKLKTHAKAGVTGALKNLVGINGNKEFLPHHRLGGARRGGDCYPGGSVLKRAVEAALDQSNLTGSPPARVLAWNTAADVLGRITRLMGDEFGVEGAWHGNDTVWRTCLDLNRILIYGRADGTLATEPQRRVLHIVDAMVAGQGDGPLAPEPLPLDLLLAGSNPAALDWIGAELLGFDPWRVPLVREAFGRFRWPIAQFQPADVRRLADHDDPFIAAHDVKHPPGWRACAGVSRQ